LKSIETGLEAVPFAVLSVSALAAITSGEEPTSQSAALAFSLSISLLSISYGLYGQVASTAKERNDDRPLPRGTLPQLFFFIACHTCWVVGALGTVFGASELGPHRWLGVPLLLVCGGGGAFAEAQGVIDVLSPTTRCVFSAIFSPLFSIVDHIFSIAE
jgi:hypothetical protein